ncbi:hypothetical protein HanPI659440_Chr16g0653971 [Helianthus annuus]|nr:hypothetical protein HanPI659440_Chr16g0653971 [Helianthus annuus]
MLQIKLTKNRHWLKKLLLLLQQKRQQQQRLMWHVLARRCWRQKLKEFCCLYLLKSLLVAEKKFYGELLSQLDVQVQEMKSMSNSIRKLEGSRLLIQMAGQTTTHVQVITTVKIQITHLCIVF